MQQPGVQPEGFTHLDGTLAGRLRTKRLRDAICDPSGACNLGLDPLRTRNIGHRVGVFEATLFDMKRRRETEDRPISLCRHDASRVEAATVPDRVHLVLNGSRGVPLTQEVPVEAVGHAVLGHRLGCGGEGLPERLAPEDRPPAQVLRLTEEAMGALALQAQQIDERSGYGTHGLL